MTQKITQVVDYYVHNGSNVYVASLDARKAFDRVNRVKLFQKLIEIKLPYKFIQLIIDWYDK